MVEIDKVKHKLYNPQKTKTMRELGIIDISGVKDKILQLAEDVWDKNDEAKPNKFKEFHSTKHIIFKFVKSFKDCRTHYELPLWEDWKDIIQPLLDEAVKPYAYTDGEFSRIMLAKLDPQSDINIHKDGNKAATFPHKIHIPIITNPDCIFFVNPTTYHFEEGKAYEVNNLAQHYVDNQGDTRRIHLIFEYYSPSLLEKAIHDSVA